FLTMQTAAKKRAIIKEAYRLLEPGGRFAFHELCLQPEQIPDEKAQEVRDTLSRSIHVHADPLTIKQWQTLVEEEGFEVTDKTTTTMSLLKPLRLISDEGLPGAIKFI